MEGRPADRPTAHLLPWQLDHVVDLVVAGARQCWEELGDWPWPGGAGGDLPGTLAFLAGWLLTVIVGIFGLCRLRTKNPVMKEKPVQEELMVEPGEAEEELEGIQEALRNKVQQGVEQRVEEVRARMAARHAELAVRVGEVRAGLEEELESTRARHRAEEEAASERARGEVAALEAGCRAEVERLQASLRELRVVVVPAGEGAALESARSELECPVCMEEMAPPRRIWQCSDGHPVCEGCRRKPEVSCCPTCRKYIVGRSTIGEKLARALCVEQEEGEGSK